MKRFVAILLALLIVISICTVSFAEKPSPSTTTSSPTETEFEPWYSYGLGSKMPNPTTLFNRALDGDPDGFRFNSDDGFMDCLIGVTNKEYELYCDTCIEHGFNIDVSFNPFMFHAKNSDGQQLSIAFSEDYSDTKKNRMDLILNTPQY